MSLPDGTAITAAGAFVSDAWDANPMLVILFGLYAIWKVGPFVLRRVVRILPG